MDKKRASAGDTQATNLLFENTHDHCRAADSKHFAVIAIGAVFYSE
jgi:hypothetical protein